LERSHQKLVEFLSDQLEVPVELMVGDNYEDVLARTRAGAFDLAILSPYLYVRAVDGNPLPCLVQMIGDGSATAAGYIVVREDSSIRDLTDLPGKRMAFVDRFSTSGYLFPAKLLLDVGIDPHKHLASADFFGNHEAVLLAVLNGEAHAGATFQGALVALKKTQSVDPLSFRVIAKTERTRRDIVCARSDLPEVVRTQIQQQLLMLTVRGRMGREILNPLNVNGFQLSEDAAYDGIREVARQVEAWENQAP
jgi:phosphonate transport system substrate-binding protein